MKLSQLAAQLYTVRDFCKTPTDIAVTLKKISAIGYPAVQASGLGPIDAAELVALARDAGLVICATHEPGDMILNRPQEVVARLQKLGCRHTAYPFPAGIVLESYEDVLAFAARLDAAGKVLHEAGLTLSYHNHHLEFRRVGDALILETLYRETDPRYLQAEIDTYWVQYGGADPVAWCQRMDRRLPLLHLKDFAINKEGQIVFAEIGAGNLFWPLIIEAADKSGCEWFIVEQDICPGDPFESLQTSFNFIRDNLCSN